MPHKSMFLERPEWRLIRQAVVDYGNNVPTQPPGRIDWAHCLALAERHRIQPLLATQLLHADISAHIPTEVVDQLLLQKQQNLASALRMAAELKRLQSLFSDAGIACRVLKGLPLAGGFYRNIIDRHVGDIDLLLLDQADVYRAHELLQDHGYQAALTYSQYPQRLRALYFTLYKENVYARSNDHQALEVHWPSASVPAFPDALMQSYRHSRQTVDCLGVPCLQPDTQALFDYLLWHGSRTQWFRLKWLVDVYLMMRQDESLQARLAEQMPRDKVARLCSDLTATLFGDSAAVKQPRRSSWLLRGSLDAIHADERLSVLRRFFLTLPLRNEWRWYKRVLQQYMIRLSDYKALPASPWFVYASVILVRPISTIIRHMASRRTTPTH